MSYWRYTERDGNPTEPGRYVVQDNERPGSVWVNVWDGAEWGDYEGYPDAPPVRWAPLPTDRPEGVDVEVTCPDDDCSHMRDGDCSDPGCPSVDDIDTRERVAFRDHTFDGLVPGVYPTNTAAIRRWKARREP